MYNAAPHKPLGFLPVCFRALVIQPLHIKKRFYFTSQIKDFFVQTKGIIRTMFKIPASSPVSCWQQWSVQYQRLPYSLA